MDEKTTKALQMVQTLIKAGKQEQAVDILVMIVRSNPNVEEAWYLLGFALIDTQKRIDSFQQVLRINPSHELAKQQLANLQTIRSVSPFTEDTPTKPQFAFMAGRSRQISN